MPPEPLVSTEWLQAHLSDPSIRVVDCRGSVATRPVSPGVEIADYLGDHKSYLASHIPGAVYVDWTRDIIDPDDEVPAQIAPPEKFAREMGNRGIGDDTHVVAVDHMGGQFATRLWWALQYYGHESVSVLDGGWHRWHEEGRPVESGPVTVAPQQFNPKPCEELRETADEVLGLLGNTSILMLDARDSGQFLGTRRRGPRGGHIPGAINVPREIFYAQGGGFLPAEEIRSRLERLKVDLSKRSIAYCNGGVAATVILFNLFRIGKLDWSLYDGSWNEWGPRADLPAEM